MVSGLYGIRLPIPDTRTVVNHFRTQFNGSTLWFQYSLTSTCTLTHPALLPATQTGAQVFLPGLYVSVSFTVYLRKDELVDRFVGNSFPDFFLDDSRNLLR